MALASTEEYIRKGRRRSITQPPEMSEQRIILLGKNAEDVGRVGNFILSREASETEVPPVEQHSMRSVGEVEGRHITLINFHHLFDTHLSEEELRECVAVSSPGPHAFLIVIEKHNFTEEEGRRLRDILDSFSHQAHKYAVVVTYKKGTSWFSHLWGRNKAFDQFVQYFGRYHELEQLDNDHRKQLLEKIDKIVEDNGGTHLISEIFVDALEQAFPHEHQTTQHEERTDVPPEKKKSSLNLVENVTKHGICSTGTKSTKEHFMNTRNMSDSTERLNVVVCGSDAAVKASISDLLMGQREQRAESSSVCVKREAEVSGHLLTLVEMPVLYNTHLSEEQVMLQTLHCVSLCPPGVHAFLFVVAEGRLTDEDKAEMEIIQRIFRSRVLQHTIVLINQKSQNEPSDESLLKGFGGSYAFIGKINTPELIICVKKLLKDNKGNHYTMDMYHEAQIKTQLQYKREIKELQQTISKHKQGSSQQPDTLRIVLLGKTGAGKSATGNTILGKDVFHEDIGRLVIVMCQKESTDINGRQITVIDTPGLFDTNIPNMETTKEITKCISMAAPGPHVFLLVLSVGSRFTQEERDTVNLIKETFGEKSQMYTMVLFSRGDSLNGNSIEQYIEKSGAEMKKLMYEVGNRYEVFNNNENKSNYAQVSALLDKIDSMIKVNGGSCYTNEMFQQVETELQKNQERILMEKQEEIKREKEELKAKYEAQMEDMKKEMETERERQNTEANRKEEEFKEKKQKIKNEFRELMEEEREYYRKKREENEKICEQRLAEINREKERNREQLEKKREEEQRQRDKEEEERRAKEQQEWEKRQREEKEKFEQEKEVMKRNAEEEVRKLQQEYEEKRAEEEKRRANLEEQIRHAEESKKKELQEQQLHQQREWERRMKEEEKKRKEQEKEWKQKIAAMEEQWSLDQATKEKEYEWEREKEKKQRDEEEKLRKEKEEQEKRQIEDEANEKIRLMKEQMEEQKAKEERERKEKDEQHKRDLEKQRQDFRKEKENEERIRRDVEERNIAFIKETHEKEKENLKKQTEQQARQQAEQEFNAKLDEKVKEAKAEEIKEGHANVESERTRPGRTVDSFINWICSWKQS